MEYRLMLNMQEDSYQVAKFYKRPDGSNTFDMLRGSYVTENVAKSMVNLYNSDLEIVKGLCVRSFEWNAFLQDPNKKPLT